MTGTSELKNSDVAIKADETAIRQQPADIAIDGDPTPAKQSPRVFLAALRARIGDWRGGLAGW